MKLHLRTGLFGRNYSSALTKCDPHGNREFATETTSLEVSRVTCLRCLRALGLRDNDLRVRIARRNVIEAATANVCDTLAEYKGLPDTEKSVASLIYSNIDGAIADAEDRSAADRLSVDALVNEVAGLVGWAEERWCRPDPVEDIATLEDSYGCDPWDAKHHGRHVASREGGAR